MKYAPLRLEGDWEMDEPFLTVKLDGWWALERVDDCVDDSEGVDIEKRADRPGYCLSCSGLFYYGVVG